jgi:hypothetical protein
MARGTEGDYSVYCTGELGALVKDDSRCQKCHMPILLCEARLKGYE